MGDDPYLPLAGHNNANGNTIIQVSNIGKTGIIILVLSVGAAFGLAAGALTVASINSREADRAEREARMLQYYVLEMDAKLIAAGFKTDAESVANKLKENGK
jgi:hypothetical protein